MSIAEPADAFAGARPVASPPLPEALPPGARAVRDVAADECRWPLGEVAEDAFRFCSDPRGRGSYCPRHAALSRRSRKR